MSYQLQHPRCRAACSQIRCPHQESAAELDCLCSDYALWVITMLPDTTSSQELAPLLVSSAKTNGAFSPLNTHDITPSGLFMLMRDLVSDANARYGCFYNATKYLQPSFMTLYSAEPWALLISVHHTALYDHVVLLCYALRINGTLQDLADQSRSRIASEC